MNRARCCVAARRFPASRGRRDDRAFRCDRAERGLGAGRVRVRTGRGQGGGCVAMPLRTDGAILPLHFAPARRHGAAMDDRTVPSERLARDIDIGAVRHDWTRAEVRALFALPFPELIFRAQTHPPRALRSDRGADLHAAVDQDRRLSGGLRLLSAERALRHRRQGREADERRCGAGRGARRQERRREPLLHGRSLARAEGPRSRQGVRDGRRRAKRSGSRPARRSACSPAARRSS